MYFHYLHDQNMLSHQNPQGIMNFNILAEL